MATMATVTQETPAETMIKGAEETKTEKVETKKNDNLPFSKEDEMKIPKSDKPEIDDSVEAGFEIIATDADENKKDAQTKQKLEIKGEGVESIGTIKDIDANKETIVSTEVQVEESDALNVKHAESLADKNSEDNKSPEASLIDIKIIKESTDDSNKESPESESHSSEELEAALTAIPELSSSVSKEILAEANDEGDVKKIVEEIETKTEERPAGTLIDITVIEETNTDKNVQEVIEEAGNSFEAEVIEDNADIEIVPADDEEVIEYTLEASDAVPFLTILVALVAIFMALLFYYN
eukprot:GFUD01032723.1.p1 GENE.GFUD01032723.1~~GFUD01032723.1.p1  ORF type:complete len:296 (+),score=118.22 GFUD01032723.1:157-1044(+)